MMCSASAKPHMRSLAGLHSTPVESEEHAVLWCGLYRASRHSLFQEVLRITGRTDTQGRSVLKNGPVDLQRLSRAGPVGGTAVEAALAIVLGGLRSTEPDRPRMSREEHSINRQLRQACKLYLGNIAQQRRQWQLNHKKKMRLRDPSRLDRWLLRAANVRVKPRTAAEAPRRRHPCSQRAQSPQSAVGKPVSSVNSAFHTTGGQWKCGTSNAPVYGGVSNSAVTAGG